MSDPSLADRPETYIDEDVETLDNQLYEGEIMVDTATVGETLVGISTHRFLSLPPETTDRRRFQSVALPNVRGFRTATGGKSAFRTRAIQAGIYTALLIGAGLMVDFQGMITAVEPPSGAGLEPVLNLVDLLIVSLGFVDELLLGLGLLALVVTVYYVGRFLGSRNRYFEVVIAGGDPLRIPLDAGARPPVDRLEEAVEKASNTSAP